MPDGPDVHSNNLFIAVIHFSASSLNNLFRSALIALVAIAFGGTAQADVVWLLQTGNSNPNGNGVYQNGSGTTGGGAILPFRITNHTSETRQLSHGSMGVVAYVPFGLKTSGMYASAWTPAGFLGGNPLAPGDLVGHASVPMPTITTVGSGSLFGIPTTNYTASWDTPGSLLDLNFILQPGETAYFTIAVPMQGNDAGFWFARESTMSAASDTLWESGAFGYQPFANIPWTEYDGRLEGNWAFVVVQSPCPGDLNGDSAVDLTDLATLLSNFGTLSGATFEEGDVNGDGAVDLTDLTALLSNFGSSCP